MGFGTELKSLRLRKGLTLRSLGALAHIDYTYLSKLEAEKAGPPRSTIIERISKALEIPPGELLLIANRDHGFNVAEVLQALFGRPEAVKPEQWREIERIAKEGLDEHYHVRTLLRSIDDLPLGEPNRIPAQWRTVAKLWSGTRGKVARSFWSLLLLFLRSNVKFHLEHRERLEELLSRGEKVVLVANHRDVTALVTFLLDGNSNCPNFAQLLVMVSDSSDGREALRFLRTSRVKIVAISRPSAGDPAADEARTKAIAALTKQFKAASKGTVAVMVIDERKGRRDRRISAGVIILADRAQARIVPVVARNKIEIIFEHSWDKHRIPLLTGKILIGEPFEMRKGRGRDWRRLEAQRLQGTLEEMDKTVSHMVQPSSLRLTL